MICAECKGINAHTADCESFKSMKQQVSETKRAIPRMPILEEREKEYGSFEKIAAVSVGLKTAFTGDNFAAINPTYIQVEAINMILTKLARIRQNPSHKDSWLDIKGYAELVIESLK